MSAVRHWCIVGFDFCDLGCCKSSGEPNSAGQRLSQETVSPNDSNGPQFAGSLDIARSRSLWQSTAFSFRWPRVLPSSFSETTERRKCIDGM